MYIFIVSFWHKNNIFGFLDPDNEEDTMSMRIAKLSDCADALDGFAIYIKFYVKFHLKIGDPQVEDTLQKMLVAVQTQEERAKQYYEDDRRQPLSSRKTRSTRRRWTSWTRTSTTRWRVLGCATARWCRSSRTRFLSRCC